MDANRTNSGYALRDELARFCLPEASRDPSRKLAWNNSVCILFRLIGFLDPESRQYPTTLAFRTKLAILALLAPVEPSFANWYAEGCIGMPVWVQLGPRDDRRRTRPWQAAPKCFKAQLLFYA